jgi:hypothetical protein
MGGRVGGWMEGKAGLRIAYSNQQKQFCIQSYQKCKMQICLLGNYKQ